MSWIDNKCELPKIESNGFSIWVLTVSKFGTMLVDRYDYENGKWMQSLNCTHWMHLPQKPSVESE